MIVDTEKIKKLLDSKNISSTQIQKITGFHRKNIWNYRTGKTKLMNMQLHVLIRLQECYDQTHTTLMKYKNFEQVINSFNNRYVQTEIYVSSDNELKIVYEGFIGDVDDDDKLIVNKKMTKKLNNEKLLKYLKKI